MGVIDDYLKKINPAARTELKRIRALAKQVVPTAKEKISYGMPTLVWDGKPFLGFYAHTNHIGIYPHSGQVIPKLKSELREFECTKSAIRVPYDKPISRRVLVKVINCRLKAIRDANRKSGAARK